MEKCPYCGSEDIYFSKKRKIFVCEECDKTFSEQQLIDRIPLHTEGNGLELFFSYGHDRNRPLVERIKRDLEARGHHVWIDTSEIKVGNNWRDEILNGVLNSARVIAFLSEHSTRNPGVCLDELKIAVCVRGADVKTVLLEPENRIKQPATLSDIQWLDMSDWYERKLAGDGFEEWYQAQFAELCRVIESPDSIELSGDVHFLKERLLPYLNSEKEYRLLSKEFYGRKWLEERIENWQDCQTSKAFIIYGRPGSGKSAFSVNYSHYNADVFGCFLCEWNREQSINPNKLIRTMAFRLASKLPDYRSLLIQQLIQDDIRLNEMSDDALFDYLLSYPLNHLVDGNRETGIIVVDGLDEAEKNGDNSLASVFARCVDRLPRWIRFVFTSRPERNVSAYFHGIESIDLVADMPQGYNDIMAFLLNAVSEELCDVPNKLEIIKRICSLSEGVFLYAEMMIDDIKSGSIDIRDIDGFPKGMNSFYRVSMERKFKTPQDFLQVRNFLEVLTVANTIPEKILTDVCGYSQYSYLSLLDKMGSWVSRQTEFGYHTLGFSHKSLTDWFNNYEQSGDFFVDNKVGALSLARFCREKIRSSKRYSDKLDEYIRLHIGIFYAVAENYTELEEFLVEHSQSLSPYWNIWKEFPENWDHSRLLDVFWSSTVRDNYLHSLQHEGNTILLLWILEKAQIHYGVSCFNKELVSIYMDTIHISGKYAEAVEFADQYLRGFSLAEIYSNPFLLNLKIRKIHHSMFYRPVQPLIEDACALYVQINSEYAEVKNELLFLIGGNLGVLYGDWQFVDEWLTKSERITASHSNPDFHKRNARKRADYFCSMGNYEKAVALIKENLPDDLHISNRYENYLVGALGNVYTCMGYIDEALECYESMLKFSANKGITGWVAHANLGIANINFKLGNLKEATDFATRANLSYRQIRQEWGLIMSGAMLAACESRMGIAPIKVTCSKSIERARRMQYGSCISSIEDLCSGKSNFLKLYFL